MADFFSKFQFHNGTIKTIFPCLASIAKILFQFHNGTIKTAGRQLRLD